MTFKQCHLGITPHCWPPAAFWELCYSAGFTCIFHHCECIWCGMRTGVNPSLAALLKPSARCLLLNNVFPSADLYLHLKGMLIAQICKQSPNNSMEGTWLLWEPSSRKHTEVWRVFLNCGSGPWNSISSLLTENMCVVILGIIPMWTCYTQNKRKFHLRQKGIISTPYTLSISCFFFLTQDNKTPVPTRLPWC